MSINIQVIADKLNISKSTVSRALRNHPDISQATKDKVMQLSEQLGYEPNLLAQALSTKKTFTIGIVIPQIGHSFFAEALQGMGDILYDAGYQILIASSNENSDRELLNIKNLLAKKVDGLIVSVASDTSKKDQFEFLLQRKIPIVFFDRKIPGLNVSSVSIPYQKIYQQKLDYAVSKGIKHLAFITGNNKGFNARQKLAAFKKAVQSKQHLLSKVDILQAAPDIQGGIQAFEALYRSGNLPQLIDTSASMQAIGILKAARNYKISIPQELELFGNYITPVTELLQPSISGAEFSIESMGRKAAQLLLEHLQDENKAPEALLIDAKLKLKESTKNFK